MRRDELDLGKVYVVAGRGELMLVEFCDPPAELIRRWKAYGGQGEFPEGTTVRLKGHGNGDYWAAPESIVREATRGDLDARDAQAQRYGLECKDPECWCREYGLVKCRHCGHLTHSSDCGRCGSSP
jgi:hypothetical protein